MYLRLGAVVLAATVMIASVTPARADNQMGYQLLTPDEAAALPRNHGALGLDIERAQQITDGGMTFEIIRVKQARPGSPGARAGLRAGDEIIAVDGRVFPTLATFAAYVGSMTPGRQLTIDYMPAGGGPQQAQRVAVTVGPAGQAQSQQRSGGMSTGEKIAIGAGAVALLGCYEAGCFSHRNTQQRSQSEPDQNQPNQGQPGQGQLYQGQPDQGQRQ